MPSDEIVTALITLVGILLPAWWHHRSVLRKKEEKIKRLEDALNSESIRSSVLDKVLELSSLNDIKLSIDDVFRETKADRFLILIAINGKVNFNVVSVIYEQHKGKVYPLNAIARYRNIQIGQPYRDMLKEAELHRFVVLETETMKEGVLRNIYLQEKVKHSMIRCLMRLSIDDDNDLIIFSSMATHSEHCFNNRELVFFNTTYDSAIVPALKRMIVEVRANERKKGQSRP